MKKYAASILIGTLALLTVASAARATSTAECLDLYNSPETFTLQELRLCSLDND